MKRKRILESDGWVITRIRTVTGWLIRAEKNMSIIYGNSVSDVHSIIYDYKHIEIMKRLERIESDGWDITVVRSCDGGGMRAEKYDSVVYAKSVTELHRKIYGY